MQNPNPNPNTHQGILPRIRSRLFGELDPVDEQLADIARQGAGTARLAHSAAFLLIILFSAGSLVALSGDALASIAARGIRPETIPAMISTAVSTLLVTCMDVALIYAASMLRILNARRAEGYEKRTHVAVLVCASLLESGTYIYMAEQYDRPAALVAWALVIARAVAAPLFSVYLSMARPLPVGPRDILYQVELATGRGVIRDAVEIANDKHAPLARKMQLYSASAVMMPQSRTRLEQMIETMKHVETPTPEPGSEAAEAALMTSHTSPVLALPEPIEPIEPIEPEPPHEPDPSTSHTRSPLPPERDGAGDDPHAADAMRSYVRPRFLTPLPPIPNTPLTRRTAQRPSTVRADAGRSRQDQAELRRKRIEIARRILAADPTVGVRDLARRIAMATKHRISESTASDIRREVLAEIEIEMARQQPGLPPERVPSGDRAQRERRWDEDEEQAAL